jgi:hypothetical protein
MILFDYLFIKDANDRSKIFSFKKTFCFTSSSYVRKNNELIKKKEEEIKKNNEGIANLKKVLEKD